MKEKIPSWVLAALACILTVFEKADFAFKKEYFADVYAQSFDCKLKPKADPRIKKLVWWEG